MMKPGGVGWGRLTAAVRVVNWLDHATPPAFFSLVGRLVPWFGRAAALLCVLGLSLGFLAGTGDSAQGGAGSLLVLLLPVMWMSVFIYAMMLFWVGLGWLLNIRISSAMVSALAPTGAVFAFLACWTGSLWGKSSAGVWWAWDVQLISELVLLSLYLMYLGLQIVIEDPRWADRASALLVVAGALSAPVVFSNLVQFDLGVSGLALLRGLGELDTAALAGMLLTMLGLWAYSVTAVLMRVRCILLEQERHAHWAGAYVKGRL